MLGGYRRHKSAALAAHWAHLPGPLRKAARGISRRASGRVERAVLQLDLADPAERMIALRAQLDPDVARRLAGDRALSAHLDAARDAVRSRLDGHGAHPLAQVLYLDAKLGLVDDMLHYFDRCSMAHSLEVRVPFLDHRLVELCATIPANLKVRRGETKHVLRRAARGLVPDWVIDKPKIGFFNAAVDSWFRAQADKAIPDFLLAPDPRYAELIDPRAVAGLVAEQRRTGSKRLGNVLLSVLLLEVWLSTYLPRAGAAAAAGSRAA
jgi:asparagine synthase (glutamine-hydrolysing)